MKILIIVTIITSIVISQEVFADTNIVDVNKCKVAFTSCDFSSKSCGIINNCITAAEQGHALAQYSVGLAYKMGIDTNIDLGKATHWINKSAKQGLGIAQLHLGLMYSRGEGVFQDSVIGLYWISKALQNGTYKSEEAMYEVYHSELKRLRSSKNATYKSILKFIHIAAGLQFPNAQHDLSVAALKIYDNSKDTSVRHKAIIDAYKWMRIANQKHLPNIVWNNPKEWKMEEINIKSKMSNSQIDEANKLVDVFLFSIKNAHEGKIIPKLK